MNVLTGKVFMDVGRPMLILVEFIYRNILWLFTFQVMMKINFTRGLQFTFEYFP